MLNSSLRVGLIFGTLTAIAGGMYACGGDEAAPGCTANQPQACAVPGTGATGTQTCLPDGSGFSACIAAPCQGGEVCVQSAIGVSFCGTTGAVTPTACSAANAPCGPSGGTCTMIPIINTLGCVKQCGASGAGGTGGTAGFAGTGGTAGFSGTGGTGGTAGFSGTGGTGGTAGTAGTGGTGGTAGFSGTGGTGGTAGFSGTGGTGGTAGTGGTGGTAGTPAPGCMGGETCNSFGPLTYCGMAGAFLPASCPTIGQPCGASGGMCVDASSFSMGFLTTACIKTCTP